MPSKYVIEKAADVAAGYVEKKENVVNLLKQQEGVGLQPGHAARALRGSQPQRAAGARASLFSNGYKNDWFGRTHRRSSLPAPIFDEGKPSASWSSATS